MKLKNEIINYDNILRIIVNDFKCKYAGCGSHQMELQININKEDLINFLNRIIKREELK